MDFFKTAKIEDALLLLSIGLILLPPTSAGVLEWLTHPVARAVFLLFVVYMVRKGPMYGLVALLAFFSVLLERNHGVLTVLPRPQTQFPNTVPAPLSKAVSLVPETEVYGYEAKEEKGDDTMHELATDLKDSNPNLEEVPQGEAASEFYEVRGLVN